MFGRIKRDQKKEENPSQKLAGSKFVLKCVFIFKVTEPNSIPYRDGTHPACATGKRAAYPDPPPVIPVPGRIRSCRGHTPPQSAVSSQGVFPRVIPLAGRRHTLTYTVTRTLKEPSLRLPAGGDTSRTRTHASHTHTYWALGT